MYDQVAQPKKEKHNVNMIANDLVSELEHIKKLNKELHVEMNIDSESFNSGVRSMRDRFNMLQEKGLTVYYKQKDSE